MDIAPNYTHIAAGQTDSLIASGSSITVYGISIRGTAAGTVSIEESDGTTIIMTLGINNVAVPQPRYRAWNIPWKAPRGVAVTTPANVTCTVFHSNAGA